MKILPCHVSINRPMNNRGPECVKIVIHDRVSTCQAIEIEMSLEEFAKCITGQGHVPGEMTFNDSGVIGMKREHKTEEVFIPDGSREDEDRISAAFKPFEVDGWEGRISDAKNSHQWTRREPPKGKKGHWHTVVFDRHVPATEADIEAARKRWGEE